MNDEQELATLRTEVERMSLQLAALSQSTPSDSAAAEQELLAIEAAALALATRASAWRNALPRERSRWPMLWRQSSQKG